MLHFIRIGDPKNCLFFVCRSFLLCGLTVWATCWIYGFKFGGVPPLQCLFYARNTWKFILRRVIMHLLPDQNR